MKKSEITTGKCYRAKVSGKLVTVRVDAIRETNSYRAHQPHTPTTRYDVTNLATGRRTTFRSAAKFRCSENLASALDKAAVIAARNHELKSEQRAAELRRVRQIEEKYSTEAGATEAERQEAHDLLTKPEPTGVAWTVERSGVLTGSGGRFRISPYPNGDWELRDELTGFYSHFSVKAAKAQAEEILAREAARAAFDPIALGM